MTFFDAFLDELEKISAAFGQRSHLRFLERLKGKPEALKKAMERAKRGPGPMMPGRLGPADPVERAAWYKRIRQKGLQGMFQSPRRLGMTPVTPPSSSRTGEVVI